MYAGNHLLDKVKRQAEVNILNAYLHDTMFTYTNRGSLNLRYKLLIGLFDQKWNMLIFANAFIIIQLDNINKTLN